MAWIGRVGSSAVAAVGAAGMYTWLSTGVVTLARMGGQVKVAQLLGTGNKKEAARFAVETAKYFTAGKCDFYSKEQFAHLTKLYGSMEHLKTYGNN